MGVYMCVHACACVYTFVFVHMCIVCACVCVCHNTENLHSLNYKKNTLAECNFTRLMLKYAFLLMHSSHFYESLVSEIRTHLQPFAKGQVELKVQSSLFPSAPLIKRSVWIVSYS